jgi:Carboxypeptidase regulatory-like domain
VVVSKVMNGVKVTSLLLACAAISGAQVVEGVVSNSVTRIGVPDVTVSLQKRPPAPPAAPPPGQPPVLQELEEPVVMVTDAAGKFHVEGLPEGRYGVQFSRDGFAAVRQQVAFVDVKAGDPVKLELQMTPLGTVSGRVLDGLKHPVAGARVVLRANGGTGIPWNCDDSGEFRFANVGARTFTLMAYAPYDWHAPEPVEGKKQAWGTTYYPGTVHEDSAGRILLSPGGEVTELEIKLQAVPVRSVTGVLVGADGKPAQAVQVRTGFSTGQRLGPTANTDDDGKFAFELMDGTYQLSAQIANEQGTQRAEQNLVVSGKDVSDIELRMIAPFEIHGTISYEPRRKEPGKTPLNIAVSGQSPAIVKVDGDTFTVSGLYPGKYALVVRGQDSPYYMDSARVSGQDAQSGLVYLGSSSDSAEVRFRSDGGSVTGTVEGCQEGFVMLEPAQHQLWFGPKVERCDAMGSFTIQAVRPGDYYAVAVSPRDASAPALLMGRNSGVDVEKLGTKLTVKAGESTRVDLKAVKAAGQ